MTNRKVWIITGAAYGLGPATIKYLLSRQQIVIVLNRGNDESGSLAPAGIPCLETINLKTGQIEMTRHFMETMVNKYGLADYLISNCCYKLIDHLAPARAQEIEMITDASFERAMYSVKFVLPYMKPEPEGHIISIPVKQLMQDKTCRDTGQHVSAAVEKFSDRLHTALIRLNRKLTFIKPGDKMPGMFCS